jgi:hypothetical protein
MPGAPCVCRMDKETAELIAALCAEAGMVMKDAVENALTMGQATSADRLERLHQLKRSAERISALVGEALAAAS